MLPIGDDVVRWYSRTSASGMPEVVANHQVSFKVPDCPPAIVCCRFISMDCTVRAPTWSERRPMTFTSPDTVLVPATPELEPVHRKGKTSPAPGDSTTMGLGGLQVNWARFEMVTKPKFKVKVKEFFWL